VEVCEIIRAVTGRDILLVIGTAVIFLIGGWLYIAWDMSRFEYLNERLVVCTITKVVHSDDELQHGYVDTAQCGQLIFKPYRTDLEYDLDSGHTYRLRVADIEPYHLTGITAVEGEP
jgi:hypothetical protein